MGNKIECDVEGCKSSKVIHGGGMGIGRDSPLDWHQLISTRKLNDVEKKRMDERGRKMPIMASRHGVTCVLMICPDHTLPEFKKSALEATDDELELLDELA